MNLEQLLSEARSLTTCDQEEQLLAALSAPSHDSPRERAVTDFLAAVAQGGWERLRARQALAQTLDRLRQEEASFARLFEASTAPTALLYEDLSVALANPALEDLLGERPLEGRPLLSWAYAPDLPLLAQGLVRSPCAIEARLRRRSGEVVWTRASVALTCTGPLVSFSDISGARIDDLLVLQEHDRALLSAEIHDGFSQDVTALSLALQTLLAESSEWPRPAGADLEAMAQEAIALLGRAGRLMDRLRNPILDGVAPSEALSVLERRTGKSIEGSFDGLPPVSAALVYRVVEELLELPRCRGVRLISQKGTLQVMPLALPGLSLTSLERVGQLCCLVDGVELRLEDEPASL